MEYELSCFADIVLFAVEWAKTHPPNSCELNSKWLKLNTSMSLYHILGA